MNNSLTPQTNVPNILSRTSLDLECLGQRYWFAFLTSSLVVFFGGLFIIYLWRILVYLTYGNYLRKLANIKILNLNQEDSQSENIIIDEDEKENDVGWVTSLRDFCGELISAQTTFGKILVVIVSLFSVASLIIYIVDANTNPIESCQKWTQSTSQQIDLVFNLFFLLYFFIRFLAAKDKLYFWLSLYSIVDYFTIPPSFVSIYLNRNWTGLRFLRVIRLFNLPDILQYLNVIKTTSRIRLAQLIVIFIAIWLIAAGFIHLIENSGDQLDGYKLYHKLTYMDCIYLIIVTLSTVGYGDVVVRTLYGRIFLLFFIVIGLAIFASAIPELASILASQPKFAGSYELEKGKKHVVVCGYINFSTASSFLREFIRKDRKIKNIEIVFISREEPNLEFEALLKKNFTQVKFFQGNLMNPKDLERVRMKQADACFVIANKESLEPEEEDDANTMLVISIKTYNPNVRVICQLLKYEKKMSLLTIPTWDWRQGDETVCIGELNLGVLAQSCAVPGFSSFIANLLAMRSYQEVFKSAASILKEKAFSDPWLAHYLRGSAMEIYTEYLSPAFYGKTFTETAILCFTKLKLLLVAIEVSNENGNGSHLCVNPRKEVIIETGARGFFIGGSFEEVKRVFYYCDMCHSNATDLKSINDCRCSKRRIPIRRHRKSINPYSFSDKQFDMPVSNLSNPNEQFDATGMFHWTPAQSFESWLRNFLLPLRSSNYHYDELKPVIFIGNKDFLEKEWKSIQNFPKVYILPGHPNNRTLLRSVNVQFCDMCVVISNADQRATDPNLLDKTAILCSLNIKNMDFEDALDTYPQTHRLIPNQQHRRIQGIDIPFITELKIDSNVQYLDEEDDSDKELYMSQPYACGTAFSISLLDCIMSTAYFNDNSLTLIRTFITGGTTPEFEQNLAESARIPPGDGRNTENRDRSRLSLVSLQDKKFTFSGDLRLYGELFVYCLTVHKILCLGVYRLRDARHESTKEIPTPSNKRYVICNPSADFRLMSSDFIYVLEQFDYNYSPNN